MLDGPPHAKPFRKRNQNFSQSGGCAIAGDDRLAPLPSLYAVLAQVLPGKHEFMKNIQLQGKNSAMVLVAASASSADPNLTANIHNISQGPKAKACQLDFRQETQEPQVGSTKNSVRGLLLPMASAMTYSPDLVWML